MDSTLIAADLILPAQFYGRLESHNLPGEQRLRIAVMKSALDDLITYVPQLPNARARVYVRNALDWVRAGELDDPFGFAAICLSLGLDQQAVRHQLEAIANGKVDMPLMRTWAHNGRGYYAGMRRIAPIAERPRKVPKQGKYSSGRTPC